MKNRSINQSLPARRFLLLIPFVITGVFLALMYLYFVAPVYESVVTMKSPVTQPAGTSLNLLATGISPNTEKLTSTSFLEEVLSQSPALIKLSFTSDFRKRALQSGFPYHITYRVTGNQKHQPQQYTIKPLNNESYLLTNMQYGIVRTKTGKFGNEIMDNNIALTVTKKENPRQVHFLLREPEFHFTIYSPASLATELLLHPARVSATDNSGIITLKVQSESPQEATTLATAIARSFTNQPQSVQKDLAIQKSTEELHQVNESILQTETEIADLKKQYAITDIQMESERLLALLNEYQIQKNHLEIQKSTLENLTKYLRKNREINNSQVEYGAISDPNFTAQIELLNKKYDEKNSGAGGASVDSEIENLKVLISERILNTRKKTAVQLNKLNRTIASTQARLKQLPEQANALANLERKMELDKKVYELLIAKKAANIVDGVKSIQADNILKPATQPVTPIWPVTWIVLTIGMLGGLVTGLGVIKLFGMIRQTSIQAGRELTEITGIPYIASIPEEIPDNYLSHSAVSNLCTALLIKPNVKVITFASTANSEGKTFIATRLAQALAAVDKKVVILDMNIDCPDIAASFNVTPDHTLADVLNGHCDIHDAISLTTFPNIEVLHPGDLTSGINTFLSSSRKDSILSTLKSHYDYIIVDTSAVENNNDAISMMKMSDLNLYIARANSTRKSSIYTAEQIQTDHGISKLNFVLNADVKSKRIHQKRNKHLNFQRRSTRKPERTSIMRRIALWFY